MRLKGKTAFITGGSRGIGKAMGERFREEGATVATCSRNECEDVTYSQCSLWMMVDVRKREDVASMFRQVVMNFGPIDILINNAGINRTADFDKQTDEEWDDVLSTDLKAVWICCQEVLPYMPDGGKIINIGSLCGLYGGPRTPSYAAAKSGLVGLTQTLARFVGSRHITANVLSPGEIDNEFTARTMSEEVHKFVRQRLMIPRTGTYEDICQAALFLAECGYITGQCVAVDGGATI